MFGSVKHEKLSLYPLMVGSAFLGILHSGDVLLLIRIRKYVIRASHDDG